MSNHKRGPGRPPLPPGERREVGTIRLTPARWGKLRTLGSEWLDRQIDYAGAPDPLDEALNMGDGVYRP